MAEDDYEPIINDEIRAWIGREDTPETVNTDGSMMQRYAHAVNDLNPLFLDDEAAKNTAFGGVIAPFQYFQIVFTQPSRRRRCGATARRPPAPASGRRSRFSAAWLAARGRVPPAESVPATCSPAPRRLQTSPSARPDGAAGVHDDGNHVHDADGKPVVTVTTTGIAR